MSSSEVEPPPMETRGRGAKSVQDFASAGIIGAIRKSLNLLPPQRRKLFIFVAVLQISLGVLDLLGILLVGLLAASAVSGTGLGSVPPQSTQLLDSIGLGSLTATQLTVIFAVSAVFVLVLKTALSAIVARRLIRFLANRQAEVSARLARAFLARPLLDVQRWTTAEAVYALGSGVSSAVVSILGSAVVIAAELFLFAIIGASLFVVDPALTILAVALFLGIGMILHRILTSWGRRNAEIITHSSIRTFSAVSEALETYRESTVLDRREMYVSRYERIVGKYATASANQTFLMEIPKYVLEATLYLAILILAGYQFLTRDIGAAVAIIAVFLAAGSRVVPALLRLQGAAISIRNAAVTAQPTFYLADFLRLGSQSEPHPDHRSAEGSSATTTAFQFNAIRDRIAAGYPGFEAVIEVAGVSVTYVDSLTPALDQVSLFAPAGSSLALVGSTGAGKSTLADIILGVLEPDVGTARISGCSPREAISRWPGAITYVPQQVALVLGTVRDNVALGLPTEAVDDDLVWEALDRARIARFLRETREGLDTVIGERGVRLSGGQRQRLGIARALYTRPLLLVLDEATSALDAETEQAIGETLSEFEGKVTTVTIAHRLATVRMADQLIYLKRGQIVAAGTFDEVRAAVPDFDRQASLLGL